MLGQKFKEFDYNKRLAVRWHIAGRCSPILIDPQVAFGAPQIKGVPTWAIQYRRAGPSGRTVLGRGDPDRLRGEPALAGLWAPVPRSGRFHLSGLPARGR